MSDEEQNYIKEACLILYGLTRSLQEACGYLEGFRPGTAASLNEQRLFCERAAPILHRASEVLCMAELNLASTLHHPNATTH